MKILYAFKIVLYLPLYTHAIKMSLMLYNNHKRCIEILN